MVCAQRVAGEEPGRTGVRQAWPDRVAAMLVGGAKHRVQQQTLHALECLQQRTAVSRGVHLTRWRLRT